MLTAIAVFAVVIALIAVLGEEGGKEVAGTAIAADGDTLVIGGKRVRMEGIDAPEMSQNCLGSKADVACGRLARDHLRGLIGAKRVICDTRGNDRYGRPLGRCRTDALDLNAAMVRQGWAVAFGDYEIEEALARGGKRGLWAYQFEPPSEWRRQRKLLRGEGKRANLASLVADGLRAFSAKVGEWVAPAREKR